MVALRSDEIIRVPLSETAGKLKTVSPEMIKVASQFFA